ncbi:hypothetical protein [Hymenobacter yonginensis]|uniref:HTH luxR-type domain-containing protein n=1 Tax=Hymenobacter yonginensis TaxID=748197 RepID=A0ABY7PSV7_9BACT|nr:hypothetical protein [Hymenobacter yonginensis]WBO85992.1 hypothetical protein O9Z63_06995 [Hymenobacter yonginensis]
MDSTGMFKEAIISILAIIANQERVLRLEATGISTRAIATGMELSPSTVAKYLLSAEAQ